jgi:hypothetical protein
LWINCVLSWKSWVLLPTYKIACRFISVRQFRLGEGRLLCSTETPHSLLGSYAPSLPETPHLFEPVQLLL